MTLYYESGSSQKCSGMACINDGSRVLPATHTVTCIQKFAYGPADAAATHCLLLQEIQIAFTPQLQSITTL